MTKKLTKHKQLLEFEPDQWLEDAPQCEADIVKAYDRWRVARRDHMSGRGANKVSPLVAESWAESCEFGRAIERFQHDQTTRESASS
jgi:hypothetical protein